mmetsp:Transcript_41288/g.113864  ORF Transcript_41288/g.113864 Transcript_41288/m.113864 type:complete len:80 (-) Transcript_41288:115-354(-)
MAVASRFGREGVWPQAPLNFEVVLNGGALGHSTREPLLDALRSRERASQWSWALRLVRDAHRARLRCPGCGVSICPPAS